MQLTTSFWLNEGARLADPKRAPLQPAGLSPGERLPAVAVTKMCPLSLPASFSVMVYVAPGQMALTALPAESARVKVMATADGDPCSPQSFAGCEMHVTPAGYPASRWLEVQVEGYPATNTIFKINDKMIAKLFDWFKPFIAAACDIVGCWSNSR